MRFPFCSFLVVALLIAAAGVSAAPFDKAQDEAIAKERQKYEGTWRLTSLEADGTKSAEKDVAKITVVNKIDGTWSIWVDGKEVNKGSSQIDPIKKPKTIDFIPNEGSEQGKVCLGIYEIDGDTRKLCFAPSGKERPTEFTSKPGSGHLLVTFKRD